MKAYFSSFRSAPDPRSAMMREAIRYTTQRPGVFLLRTLNRLRAFWGFDYLTTAIVQSEWPSCGKAGVLAVLAIEATGYALVMLLAIAGLFMFTKGMAFRFVLFLIAIVLAYQSPYVLSFANGTYHPPVVVFLFPFAAMAMAEIRRGRMAVGAKP
jgi:hypothetical protein